MELPRKLVAEGLGTLLLLATVIGSGIMAENLADGNAAVALLGNTLATGAILAVLITMLGPISGAHFNPAVTMAFLVRREIDSKTAAAYLVVQIAGGLAGAVLAHAMFDMDLVQVSTQARTGAGQWLAEGVATFGLVATILATLKARPSAVAAMGRSLHQRRLLVHGLHILRQPGGDGGPIFHRHVQRHCARRRPGVHRCAVCRCRSRHRSHGVAAQGSAVVRRMKSASSGSANA